jgi:hypothetical protein
MSYNFEFALSAKISSKVVEDMIRKVVEEQTSRKVDRIELKTTSISRGMGTSEFTETAFDGAIVYFINEQSTVVPTSTGRAFKSDTYT